MSKNLGKQRKTRKFAVKYFIAIHLGVALISLLSVIPYNLNMSSYGIFYDMVPASSAMMLIILSLVVVYPIFELSKQKINSSSYKLKFLRRTSFSTVFFIVTISVSFLLLILLAAFSSQTGYQFTMPIVLGAISIPLSSIIIISTFTVFEYLSFPNNQERENEFKFKKTPSILILILIVSISLLQLIPLVAFIPLGIIALVFIVLFIFQIVIFFKNYQEKSFNETESKRKPFLIVILQAIFSIFTLCYYLLILLYILFLTRGYLIINFDEFYPGFFLAIQGIYTLLLILFNTIIYTIMLKKQMI